MRFFWLNMLLLYWGKVLLSVFATFSSYYARNYD